MIDFVFNCTLMFFLGYPYQYCDFSAGYVENNTYDGYAMYGSPTRIWINNDIERGTLGFYWIFQHELCHTYDEQDEDKCNEYADKHYLDYVKKEYWREHNKVGIK